MKKIIAFLLIAAMMVTGFVSVEAAEIGDIVNKTVYTDIVTKINGSDIASFNIDGYTVVVAEDLRNYGFNVEWRASERALYITKNTAVNRVSSTYKAPVISKYQVGVKANDVLYSDIKTYIDGTLVTSYNIGGQTVIYFDDLKRYGTISYDDSIRTLSASFPWLKNLGEIDPIEFSGRGDKVISNVNIPAGSFYAELTHNGKSNFISKLYYGEKSYNYFRLSNEIGPCAMQVALYDNGNAAVNGGMLEVKADGDWTIKIKPVTGKTTTNVKGKGEIVTGIFTATNSRVAVNLSHKGKSNFIAKIIKYNGTKSYDYESLANEIGDYSGQKIAELTPGAQYYFYVMADGEWRIDLGLGDNLTTYSLPSIPVSGNNSKNDYDDYDDYDDYEEEEEEEEDDKFSMNDAELFNKYAAAATKACNNAAKEALSAAKANSSMKTLYIAKALNYASTAKNNMNEVIDILEDKVELTYTDGDTVLDRAEEAMKIMKKILKFDAEDDDINDLMDLCMSAAAKSLAVQKASVELMGAFLK